MEENDQFNFVHTRYNHISKGAYIYFTNISHPVPSSLLTAPATYANFLFLEHPMLITIQSLFGLLVSSSCIFRPWLFVWSTLFHLSSLNSAFHISERTSFTLQCKLTPSTLLFPIQNSLLIPLISTSKMKFSCLLIACTSLSIFIM